MQELRTSYDQICSDYHEIIKDMEGNKVNITNSGFPPALENLEYLEKWDNFFQSGKSLGILKKSQGILNESGKVRENCDS